MPCPTCNATLQNLGLDQPGRRTFWCPNCGTLKWERWEQSLDTPAHPVLVEIDVPKGTKLFVAGGTESDEFVRWQKEFNDRVARAHLVNNPQPEYRPCSTG